MQQGTLWRMAIGMVLPSDITFHFLRSHTNRFGAIFSPFFAYGKTARPTYTQFFLSQGKLNIKMLSYIGKNLVFHNPI